jgi:hypothetical protein
MIESRRKGMGKGKNKGQIETKRIKHIMYPWKGAKFGQLEVLVF